MAVSNVATNNSDIGDALSSSGNVASSSAIKDQFLKMLVTQLTNQDPLNPLDNSQLTSQLAQISTVESLENLNSTVTNTLSSLQAQIATGQSLQTTALIGKEVMVPGSRVLLGTDPSDPSARQATPMGVDFATPVSSATIKITDSAGNLVRTIELGAQPIGVGTFTWDGMNGDGTPAPDGAYTAAVSATDTTGAAIDTTTMLTYGKVSSVAYSASGIQLDLGTAGQVGVGDIVKVF